MTGTQSTFLQFLTCWLLPGMLCIGAHAQTESKVTVDRNSILIGEQIKMTLEVDIPENEPIGFFRLDTIPHFEILRREKADTNNTSKGTVISQVIWLTSFDSGHWVIGSLSLQDSLYRDSIGIDVGYTPFDTKQPYHDITDIIDVDEEEKQQGQPWWWYVVGGVVLLAVVTWLVLRRKKPAPVVVAAPPPDPYKVAMDALAGWKDQTTDRRLYYSALVNIFREYLQKRRRIESMQQTTDELVRKLKDAALPAGLPDSLPALLRLGDLVKFARQEPTQSDDEEIFVAVKKSIERIEQFSVQEDERLRAEAARRAKAEAAKGTGSGQGSSGQAGSGESAADQASSAGNASRSRASKTNSRPGTPL